MPEPIQPFANLDAETEAALRASIVRFGVIIPVVKDQHGRILDGNQRARIADDLGATFEEIIVKVENDEEAREYARTLNADRRHLTPEQRRAVVGALREQGHSVRAIAGAVGASKSQVARDLPIVPPGTISPERIARQGGGTYPARRLSPPVKNQQDYEAARKAKKVGPDVPGPAIGYPGHAATRGYELNSRTHDLYELIDWVSHLDALHATDEYVAAIELRRRATTAKRLRKAGMFFGRIAWGLEHRAEAAGDRAPKADA